MKKLLGTALILLSTLFIGYSQQDNNSSDDAYYNDDNTAQPQPGNPAPQDQNYDDDNNADNGAPTYQTFYDQLSSYGSWVQYGDYGYCWVPDPTQTPAGFSPYTTNGHWVYTDMGWTWVSDFAWGWGPFHYGRWFEDANYGWMWVPGYDWAPAWVIWGDYGGYYGWACLGPRDILSPHFRPDPGHWHFIEHQYMGRDDFRNHIMRNDEVAHNIDINNHINIISHANTYHQSVFFAGPKAEEVEHYSGQKVQHVQINNVRQPGQTKVNNNAVNIYRPNIVRNNQQHAVPAKVNDVHDLKPANRPNNQNRTTEQQRPAQNQPARQQPAQQWTPPRQNTPRQEQAQPAQQQQRQYTPQPSQPSRSFIPSSAPAQHYSAPAQQHYSAPAAPSAPRGGGGGRR